MDEDCPFCRIVAGERPAALCYEDEDAIAFLDENPATEGHTLVIPTGHREELLATDGAAETGANVTADAAADPNEAAADGTAEAVFETATRVGTALDSVLEPDGFSLFHTSGPLVGRVTHAHVHVVPRYEDDGVGFGLPRDRLEPSAGERLAERIAAEL